MATQPTAPPQWTVTTQQEVTQPDATGRYVQGVKVGFQTVEGILGSVFIPDAQYSAQNVQQAVQARVDQMRSVQTLQG